MVAALNDKGEVIQEIDYDSVIQITPRRKIARGDGDKKDTIYMYDGEGSASLATQDQILESISTYFKTHDIDNYDILDLWFEVELDHFCAWIDPAWNED